MMQYSVELNVVYLAIEASSDFSGQRPSTPRVEFTSTHSINNCSRH